MNPPEAIYRRVGERIRFYRHQRNLSQSEVADQCGWIRTSLATIESGRQRISLCQVAQIARALGVRPLDLVPEWDSDLTRIRGAALAKLTEEEKEVLGLSGEGD